MQRESRSGPHLIVYNCWCFQCWSQKSTRYIDFTEYFQKSYTYIYIFIAPLAAQTSPPSGSVENGILQALVPTQKGTLKWNPTEQVYQLTYSMGSEVISKSVSSLSLAMSWFSRMEASANAGSCSKGVAGMGKPTIAAEAGLGKSSLYIFFPT